MGKVEFWYLIWSPKRRYQMLRSYSLPTLTSILVDYCSLWPPALVFFSKKRTPRGAAIGRRTCATPPCQSTYNPTPKNCYRSTR